MFLACALCYIDGSDHNIVNLTLEQTFIISLFYRDRVSNNPLIISLPLSACDCNCATVYL